MPFPGRPRYRFPCAATLNLDKLPAIIGFAWFAEVIVVSGTVTAQQVSSVEAYSKTKYGL